MLNAQSERIMLSVHVLQDTRVIHMFHAGSMNALQTQNANNHWLAEMKSVLILVNVLEMPSVVPETIVAIALVCPALPVMHTD